ncbi:MAG: flavin reductase family protein, partial [Chloroflexi bacterium]|nr:flavin reductase family protein [Chloroflexota bacterium]
MRRSLEDMAALRLLNGGPTALLTTRWRDKTNVMPVIWMTQLSAQPTMIGVAINPARFTHDLVRYAEQFALNFPARDLLNHTHYFGSVSGEDVGKIELSKLATFNASKVDVPLLENCVAWIECGLEDTMRIGDHTLFIGRVLAVQGEEESFGDAWLIEDFEYRPLHYLGRDRYATLRDVLQAELRTDEEGAIELAESDDERERRGLQQCRRHRRLPAEGGEVEGCWNASCHEQRQQ